MVIAIQREEDKVKKSLKEAAKKSDADTCKVLAKEVIHARKAINKIYTSKAHLNSVTLQMKNQLGMYTFLYVSPKLFSVFLIHTSATLRVAGSLSKSTEVMQAMQRLIRIPEVAHTMQELSKEMMKAGIIEEMLDETMDTFEDTEELEEAAQGEIDNVLYEITKGEMGKAPDVPNAEMPEAKKPVAVSVAEEEDESELEEMQTRLAALKS